MAKALKILLAVIAGIIALLFVSLFVSVPMPRESTRDASPLMLPIPPWCVAEMGQYVETTGVSDVAQLVTVDVALSGYPYVSAILVISGEMDRVKNWVPAIEEYRRRCRLSSENAFTGPAAIELAGRYMTETQDDHPPRFLVEIDRQESTVVVVTIPTPSHRR